MGGRGVGLVENLEISLFHVHALELFAVVLGETELSRNSPFKNTILSSLF
jgi:hypothetical protein